MMRKRVLAFLLTLAVLSCGLVFSASADTESCEIELSIVGAGSVTINGTQRYAGYKGSFDVGEVMTMTATPDEDSEFLFWLNVENNRVVSWDATYTFTASTYASFEAVFDDAESVSAEYEVHTVIYLTDNGNIIYSQQNVELYDTSFIEDVPTSGMFVSGKRWVGWDKTAEQVAATPGRVYVHPIYSTDVSFNVTATIDGSTVTYNKKYLSMLTLEAPAVNQQGQAFSYWIALAKDVNAVDEIASFYAKYQFIVTGDVALEAVYGETYENGYTARITGDFPSFEEAAITLSAEHSVTKDYTVIQHGMLITKNMRIGSFDSEFRIGQSDDIYKMTSNDTTLVGNFRVPISNWTVEYNVNGYDCYPRIFARAYVIVKDKSTGITYTHYSSIYCVDYQFESGIGSGDNNDDPFG